MHILQMGEHYRKRCFTWKNIIYNYNVGKKMKLLADRMSKENNLYTSNNITQCQTKKFISDKLHISPRTLSTGRHFMSRVQGPNLLISRAQPNFGGSLHRNTLHILQCQGPLSPQHAWENFTRASLDFQRPGGLKLWASESPVTRPNVHCISNQYIISCIIDIMLPIINAKSL